MDAQPSRDDDQRDDQHGDSGGDVERGAAEENSGAPLTEMEREVSRPPEERWAGHSGSDQS